MEAGVKILVAEDEEPIRDVVCSVLKQSTDAHVDTAENGSVAYQKMQACQPDVLITDLVMPGMGGEELVQRCLELDPDLTVLVMTGNGTIDKAVSLMKEGVFDFLTKPFSLEDLQSRIDRGVQRAKSLAEVQGAREAVDTLMNALESKDRYLGGHGKRVSEMCGALARLAGWSRHQVRIVEYAGLVHDVGKIGVPEQILNKPGPLTPEEMELVKRHPIYSREILEPVRFLEEALPLVYHHHERYDGGGYPDGIAGEDIPEGARIISVCDTYDAMRSTRSYRTSRPEHRILEIIEKERGKQLDARYVDLFLEHLDEIRPENVNQIHEESVFACV